MARNINRRARFLFSVAFCLTGVPVFAQDAPPERAQEAESPDIVVTGRNFLPDANISSTKLDQPLAETPQSITVINEELFESLGVTNYYDALRFVPGVAFAGNFGTFPGLSARGYVVGPANSYKINGTPTGAAKPFDSIAVERLEFVKGGSGTTFGEGGPGGFVNLITRRPGDTAELEVLGQAGSFDFFRGSAVASTPLDADGDFGLLGGVAVEKSDSFVRFENSDNLALYGVATAKFGERFDAEAMVYFNDQDLSAYNNGWPLVFDRDPTGTILRTRFPDFLPQDFNSGQPWSSETFRMLYLRGELGFNIDADHRLAVLGARTDIKNRQRLFDLCCEITPAGVTDAYAYYGSYRNELDYVEARFTGRDRLGAVDLRYLLSGEYRRRLYAEGFNDYDSLLPGYNLNNPRYDIPDPFAGKGDDQLVTNASSREVKVWSGSASVIAEIGALTLTGGVRYDKFTPTNRTFAGNYRTERSNRSFPADNWAFRGAATYEFAPESRVYYSFGQTFEINLGRTCDGSVLPPETGRIHEVGYKQGLLGGQLLVTAAAYHIRTKGNLVGVSQQSCPGATDSVVRAGEGSRSKGFELEAVGRLSRSTNLIAGIAVIDAKRRDGGAQLDFPQVPKFQATLFLTYDILTGPLEGLGFGLGGEYVGRRIGTNAPFGGGPEDRYVLPKRFRGEAAAYYRLNDRFSLALNVKNVFDAKQPQTPYSTTDFQNQWLEPRTVLLTLKAGFGRQ